MVSCKKVLLSPDFSRVSQVSLLLFTVYSPVNLLTQNFTPTLYMNMCQEMLQCSDILHRTAINFEITVVI